MRKNERQGFENLRRVIKVERRGSRGDKTYEERLFGLCYAMDGGYKGWNPYKQSH